MVRKVNSSNDSGANSSEAGSADNNPGIGGRFARSAAGLLDSELAVSVKESAQQIWLAGMGAFAKAQEEGGKVFDTLVKEGMTLQKKTQVAAEEAVGDVSSRMSAMADTVSAKAGQNWDKLEAIFEQRTAKALGKLGMPTAKELQTLARRVDALEAAVAGMGKAPARKVATRAAAKAPGTASAAAKTVAKTAAKTDAKTAGTTPAKPAGPRRRKAAAG